VEELKLTRSERMAYLETVMQPIEKELRQRGFDFEIVGRPKHLFSIYNKMRSQGKSLSEIYDLYGIRIILNSDNPSDCFSVYGYITQIFQPVPERFKDYISVPKHNGYQSLHTTIIGPKGRMVEVQIRTRKMHEFAENGVAAHWRYKEKVSTQDEAINSLIRWARELIENAESATAFMEGFRMNLYQDEIYVFTPKGDMKVLPRNATPVDFAFEIHTEIGMRCIGAKVNGKIVALHTKLKSGDQVEIITSKNQTPKADWEKFVVTHKAKLKIRQFLNEERRQQIEEGRTLWSKLIEKTKRMFSENDIVRVAKQYGLPTVADFFQAIARKEINPEKALSQLMQPEQKPEKHIVQYSEFLQDARRAHAQIVDKSSDAVIIEGMNGIAYGYAKCCNPVPGDEIIGIVTAGGVVKIHRRNCRNVNNEHIVRSGKLVSVNWKASPTNEFLAGLRIFGEDRMGMTNAITQAILKTETNIRSIALNAKDGIFEGTVVVYVKDIAHLNRLVEKVKRIDGVFTVERFSNA